MKPTHIQTYECEEGNFNVNYYECINLYSILPSVKNDVTNPVSSKDLKINLKGPEPDSANVRFGVVAAEALPIYVLHRFIDQLIGFKEYKIDFLLKDCEKELPLLGLVKIIVGFEVYVCEHKIHNKNFFK
jgi:hypothetical protein